MRKTLAALLAIVAFVGATSSPAREVEVSFSPDGAEERVRGVLKLPELASPPVVLLLHGFTGSRDEMTIAGTGEGIYARTARRLAQAGIASLRIDFRGSGASDGNWAESTVERQVRDAVAAIDWLTGSTAVDGTRVAVLGWSLGGLVGSHAAAQRPRIRSLVLWAPVVHWLHTIEHLFSPELVAGAWLAQGDTPITARLPWGGDTTLNAAFFQELPRVHGTGAIAGYAGPLKVIAGADDRIVFPQPATSEALLRYHPGEESLTVLDTDHIWSASLGPQLIDDELIPLSLAWLRRHFEETP